MNNAEYRMIGLELCNEGFAMLDKAKWHNFFQKLDAGKKIKRADKKTNIILISVAMELLLKAAFATRGYLIFKTKPMIKISSFRNYWNLDRTVEMKDLIENLDLVFSKRTKPETIKKHKQVLERLNKMRNGEVHFIRDEPISGKDYIETIGSIVEVAHRVK